MINKIRGNYPVEIRQTTYGKGLFATRQIKTGDIVLAVSQKYFLTFDDLINKYPGIVVKDKRSEFAYRLASQVRNILISPYRQYLLTLPKSNCTPICIEMDGFQHFQNKDFAQHMIEKSKRVRDTYEQIHQFAKLKHYPLVSISEFLYCYSLIQSRTLYFQTELDPTSEVGAMIPLYDMCNHSEQVNRQNIFKLFYFDKEIGAYLLKAYKDYQVNEQIYISYGSYNNKHFVEFYGFVPENNPNNIVIELRLNFNKEKNQAKKLELIEMVFPQKISSFPRTLKDPLILSVNQHGQILEEDILWILSLKEQSVKQYSKKQLFGRLHNNFQQLCDVQRFKALLQELVRQALKKYTTSIQQDSEIAEKNKQIGLQIQYRMAEKQQILRILNRLP